MKTCSSNQRQNRLSHLHGRTHWLKKPMMSDQYHHWLIDSHSLTQRLQQRYKDFSVIPALIAYKKPFLDELLPLNISHRKKVLIREVKLMGSNQLVVYAHSVLPRKSLRGAWLGLRNLGNKPLGAMLFANPQVSRAPLSYKKLKSQHVLYRLATKDLITKPAFLWARRSVFSLNCASIMITEVFLPQLLDH